MSTQTQENSVLVVGVSYKSGSDLRRFLATIPVTAVEVVIIENSQDCDDWETALAVGLREGVQVRRAPANLGYFGALKYAYNSMDSGAYRWIVLTNVDVEFQKGFFETLAEEDPGVCGVLAPDIRDLSTGRQLNPYMRTRPSKRTLLRIRSLFKSLNVARLWVYSSSFRIRNRPSTAGPARERIYAPHGAVMCFSRRFFDIPSALNFPSFLFGEEIFVGEMCRRANLPIVVAPQLRVAHVGHVSTGVWRSREVLSWQRDSMNALYRLLYGKGGAKE